MSNLTDKDLVFGDKEMEVFDVAIDHLTKSFAAATIQQRVADVDGLVSETLEVLELLTNQEVVVVAEAGKCPECETPYNKTDIRRIFDSCGHVKCWRCLATTKSCLSCKENVKEKDESKKESSVSSSSKPSLAFLLFGGGKEQPRVLPHPCDQCGERFALNWDLDKHLENVHSIERYHVCPHCHRMFGLKEHFDRHVSTHAERRFKCSFCDVAFLKKQTLEGHFSSQHGKSKQVAKQLANGVEEQIKRLSVQSSYD